MHYHAGYMCFKTLIQRMFFVGFSEVFVGSCVCFCLNLV